MRHESEVLRRRFPVVRVYAPHRRSGNLVRAAQFRIGALAFATVMLGLTMLDYVTGWQVMLHGDPTAPRTNPQTFLALTLCLLATLQQRPLRLARPEERRL